MKNCSLSLIVIALLVCAGCQKEPLDTIRVSGTVTVDNEPMAGITVIFNPLDAHATGAGGVTNAQGIYTLTSGANTPGTGALAGSFIPTFSKVEAEEREPTASPDEEIAKYGWGPPKLLHLIPVKYGNTKTCGFGAIQVEKGAKNVFDFDLSKKNPENK